MADDVVTMPFLRPIVRPLTPLEREIIAGNNPNIAQRDLLRNNLTFDDNGQSVVKGFSVDIQSIPAYPLMTVSHVFEYFPRAFLAKCLTFCEMDSTPRWEKLRTSTVPMLKDMFYSVNPESDLIKVTHTNRKNVGRFYANRSGTGVGVRRNLTQIGGACGSAVYLPRALKNTAFHAYGYVDIDQVKCHPTLLAIVAELSGMALLYLFQNTYT